MPSLEVALRDFSRVAKLGGEVRCTLPLAGTFQEFHDLYREVLIKHDKHEALERLERHIARFPTIEHVEQSMAAANLQGGIELDEFELLFKSSREFFFAPVIEYGPLQEWKDIAGAGQEMQDVFWYIKEAIDSYFGDSPFCVTVKAGCLIGHKKKPDVSASGTPQRVSAPLLPPLEDTDEELDDDRDTGLPLPPHKIAAGSVRVSDPDDYDVIEESLDFAIDPSSVAEQELDAFIEGKKRPSHLDRTDDFSREDD
jgi:hypothetical protein